jgi:hypothetical protein
MRLTEINITSSNTDTLDDTQLTKLIELIIEIHNKKLRSIKTGYKP